MRIRECFIADVNFGNEPFISKALSCLCAFINSDFSEKPWNRQLDFDTFISPKKNESLSLKDHRFNRVSNCCTNILYHLDDISRFLDIHKGIVNGLAVLDRTFIDMEVLKSLFCASSLIGIHFANPFLVLLLRKKTTYETLLESYPKLYEDLNMQVGESFLQTERRIVSFVEDTTFTESLPKSHLRENVAAISSQYKDDVLTILKSLLPRIAESFSTQRGAIFGFGPLPEEDTGGLLKVSHLHDSEKHNKLLLAPVHNLSEERSVGSIGYELSIRGKNHLESASKKHVYLFRIFNVKKCWREPNKSSLADA